MCGLPHVLRALALGRRQSSRSSATTAHHGSDGGTLAARGTQEQHPRDTLLHAVRELVPKSFLHFSDEN